MVNMESEEHGMLITVKLVQKEVQVILEIWFQHVLAVIWTRVHLVDVITKRSLNPKHWVEKSISF